MKTQQHPERFTRAIDALVRGYLNNTIAKGTCVACAVGNIVAASIGCEVSFRGQGSGYYLKDGRTQPTLWHQVFVTRRGEQIIDLDWYQGRAKEEIDATGYSWQDLAKVEAAFESSTEIFGQEYSSYDPEEIDADQYNGLMAVVDVLCEIEGIEDAEPIRVQFEKVAA